MKDYRESHQGERKTKQYEEQIYKRGSYDDLMWEWEQPILSRCFQDFQKGHAYITYLDFGCGTGRITQLFEKNVDVSVGVDISSAMIERARTKLQRTELIVADLTKNDVLRGRTFEYITMFRVLLNSDAVLRKDIMKILTPKLSPDGILIFNMHGNILSYRMITKIWLALRGRRLNTVSHWSVLRFVREHQLQVVQWYGLGVIPKIFYRIFGGRLMLACDQYISRLPGARYFAYNLIYICRKASQ